LKDHAEVLITSLQNKQTLETDLAVARKCCDI